MNSVKRVALTAIGGAIQIATQTEVGRLITVGLLVLVSIRIGLDRVRNQ